jgi:hypothetical protein
MFGVCFVQKYVYDALFFVLLALFKHLKAGIKWFFCFVRMFMFLRVV